ncbi:MAG TPA: SGNH/GDSL hydrolase family protein [Trichocoleus sp.]
MPRSDFLIGLTRVFWASAVPLSLSALAPLSVQAASFNRLFVFGDSLSDPGNTATVTKGLFPPPVLPGVDSATNKFGFFPAYTQQRFTDNLNWIDYLAPKLGVTSTTNYAFAGATTGTQNTTLPFLPGLQQQISTFLFSLTAPTPEDLFVVWAGSNDYLATASQTNPNIPVGNLESAVRALADAGAQNILVANLEDLGKTPLVKSQSNAEQVSELINQHNTLLTSTLTGLATDPSFEDASLISFDVFSLLNEAISQPEKFGFTNVSDPCLANLALSSLLTLPILKCANPDQYLFWDSLHPTDKAHQILADAAFSTIKASSEASNPIADTSFSILQTSYSVAVPEPVSNTAVGVLGSSLVLTRLLLKKVA